MTDVTPIGQRRAPLGDPLCLAADAFQRIVEGRQDLQHSDGTPNISRLAKLAGVHKQRLNDVANGSRGLPGIHTMGTAVRCYAKVHGVTTREAIDALIYMPEDDDTEAVAA